MEIEVYCTNPEKVKDFWFETLLLQRFKDKKMFDVGFNWLASLIFSKHLDLLYTEWASRIAFGGLLSSSISGIYYLHQILLPFRKL